MTYTDVSIDLETLGTAPGCPVVSIGLVFFRADGGPLGSQRYWVVDLASQLAAGMLPNAHTLRWWMAQSDTTRSVFASEGTPPEQVLHEIAQVWPEDARVWGHGSVFDVSILEALYRCYGIAAPWHFSLARDTRTLFELAGVAPVRDETTHHNALSDAVAQAEAVQQAWRQLHP